VFFWHIGGTIAIVRYAFRDERMDLRFLALGALLPDIIDKPIALLFFSDLQASALVAHTLIFSGALMAAVVLATRRGRPRRRWMALAVGALVHLLLDFLWGAPETLFWPFLGLEFAPATGGDVGGYLGAVFGDPWRWVQEAAGLAYLLALYRKADLSDAGKRRKLVATGEIDAPIGRPA
jgi:hypothetical protein